MRGLMSQRARLEQHSTAAAHAAVQLRARMQCAKFTAQVDHCHYVHKQVAKGSMDMAEDEPNIGHLAIQHTGR